MNAVNAALPLEFIGLSILLVLTTLLIGLLWGRSGRGRLIAEKVELRQQLVRVESQTKDHQRTVSRMREELNAVTNLGLSVPPVVRDLNRNDLQPSDVPDLIIRLAMGIFHPEQVLLYGVRTIASPVGPQRELFLMKQHGLNQVPEALKTVPVGKGRIGWAAAHELDMLPEDWEKITRTERMEVESNHPMFKADMLGPLVHHAKDNQQLLGVLCIGKPQVRHRNEKLMFQMVNNLGSLAIVTSRHMTQLRSMAHHDGLTGLLNKRAFTQDLAAKALMDCESRAKPFSVFIFDIDHFKNYNDTNGHPAGDDLLRRMAKIIRQSLRPGDLACRYGGEEFVIAMPSTEREAGLELADRFRQVVASTDFLHREKQPLGRVSISGGVAASPKDGNSVLELIRCADQALYENKKGGRDSVGAYKGVQIGDVGEDWVPATPSTPPDPSDVGFNA